MWKYAEKYSGIYITTAIRVLDGVLGVYVENERAYIWSVEVIYRTDDFVLTKGRLGGIAPFKAFSSMTDLF